MNLLFFTIEVGDDTVNNESTKRRLFAAQTRRRGRLRWIGLGIVAVVSAVAAGCGGWLLAGGDPAGVELPGWVAFAPSVSAASHEQARLQVTSQPDGAVGDAGRPSPRFDAARAGGISRHPHAAAQASRRD